MNNIIGTTDSETAMIKAIQRAVGAAEDGEIGGETMAAIAARLGADCFPITLEIYDQPTIIAKDVVVCNPSTGLRAYNNSLSGSFSYQKKPCSILVNWGKAVCESACHAWLGQPETVLYRLYSGEFGIRRCMSSKELPDSVKWAVGGMGLLDLYGPQEEGFSGQYADVLRRTNHTALGVKGGMVYLIYCANMTGGEVDEHCRKLGLELAVMLDGGHVAAINGAESFAKLNTGQIQYYMIQGV
ncbi:MAG TPA: hypothetical protein H9868_00610 [Candidatus Flavonifractor merdipullorum]|uniref:Uncharacterized protein n=1 Tax=Candidatus Flavonifractor merdipullorum TaxID=2838590 RepID=A0A9D1RSZ6_9FIRM|nr:hypothetical protein [Candidatus Flavonifractor merdipullorum]